MADQLTLGADFGAAPREPVKAVLPGVVLLAAFAHQFELLGDLTRLERAAPPRHMVTPGGFRMSVAMTNCGELGWVTDARGYRYQHLDPVSQLPWPPMPASFHALATAATQLAGFGPFEPDACLINRYQVGASMALHQDKNERDLTAPIVSVSLGLPAVFQVGGLERTARALRVPLVHGDVVVWGGPSRLRFHGVLALKAGHHPVLGAHRINLTFRRAG
jgi:alkylated DNA repair protein (DNA oxidative demethylase)